MELDGKMKMDSVSDDDEIDYTTKPEFYDPDLDEKDESWVRERRRELSSDAMLSCPACFTTLCLECQRHEKYVTQYRAVFVMNCKINHNQVLMQNDSTLKRDRRAMKGSSENEACSAGMETVKQVCCSVCFTEVGVIDGDEVYHFFNTIPSEP